MAARRREPSNPTPAPASGDADVILDVVFEDGLLFLDVANLGERPAHRVRVRFEPAFRGVGGRRTSSLAVFRRLDFLAPHKRIRVFLDRSDSYFARGEPTRIDVALTWAGDDGTRRSRALRHDLEIYRDLVHLTREVPHRAHET